MKNQILLILLIAFLLLSIGCPQPPDDGPKVPAIIGKLTTGKYEFKISGNVYDSEENALLGGVLVALATGETTKSDFSGKYEIKTNAIGKGLITFRKEGYVPLHKSFGYGSADFKINAKMFRKTEAETISLSSDGAVEMDSGKLEFEKESFVVKGTGESAGNAEISLTAFDPADEAQLDAFPGEFQGIRGGGEETAFETFGFMKIIVGEGGKSLDLAPGKTATIEMPISPKQNSSAPSTIPLWYFDEEKETWVERGTATKICAGASCLYRGNTDTIASFWSTSQSYKTSRLRGRVVLAEGLSPQKVLVQAKGDGYAASIFQWLDIQGDSAWFELTVKSGSKIKVFASAGNYVTETMLVDAPAEGEVKEIGDIAFSPDSGLLAYYKFEGNANDETGTNNGALNGGIDCTAEGISGKGCHFDGVDDYIEILDSNSLHSDREITVTGWFKVTSQSGIYQSIYWKGEEGVGTQGREYSLWLYSSGILHSASTPVSEINSGQVTCNTAWGIEIGKWYHFATVISSETGKMKTYLNSKIEAECDYDSSGIRDTEGPLRFGKAPEEYSHFNGTLDEIKIYNYALPESEIRQQYLAGSQAASAP
ncbi:MAG: LamG-like jellyroll fold domain-containing protein [Candidatus Diapherotrites archaeon]